MNKKYIIISVVAVMLTAALGISFAYFAPAIEGTGKQMTITSGLLSLDVADSNVVVTPTSALKPILASQVDTSTDAYRNTFSVTRSNNSLDACYSISLVVDSIGTNLINKWFKYKLTDGTNTVTGNFINASAGATKELLTGYYKAKTDSTTSNYTLTLWLEYDSVEDQSSILTSEESTRTFSGHLMATATNGTCPAQGGGIN